MAKGWHGARCERARGSLFHPYHLETSGFLASKWPGKPSVVPAPLVLARRLIQPLAFHPFPWSGWVAKELRGAHWERTCESLRQPYRLITSAASAHRWPGDLLAVPGHFILAEQCLLPEAHLRTLVGWRGSDRNCVAPLEHNRIALPYA